MASDDERDAMVNALAGKRRFAGDHPINGRSPVVAPPDSLDDPGTDDGAGAIYLVRHGATKLNNTDDTSQDRIRGWTDVPLTDEGRKEAEKAGQELKGKGVQVIVASDLSRAKETADIIGKIVGVQPTFSHDLRPWNLGKFSGQSTKEALPKLAEYASARPAEPVPQGESFDDFKARAFKGLADAVRTANGQTLAIVTHHRLERLVEAWIRAGQPASHDIDLDTFLQKGDPPGGVERLALDPSRLMATAPQSNGEGAGEAGEAAAAPPTNTPKAQPLAPPGQPGPLGARPPA